MNTEKTENIEKTESTESTENSQIVPLFKTRKRVLRIPSPFGVLTFKRGQFASADKQVQEFMQNVVCKDPAMQVFVDPKEPTIDLSKQLSQVQLRQQELADLVSLQAQSVNQAHNDPHTATASVMSAGTNSGSVATDLTAQLKQKLAAQALKQTKVSPEDLGA